MKCGRLDTVALKSNVTNNREADLETYLAGMTNASNSATKCLLIILLDGGIPSAVAMVSPVNDGSKTTRPP